MDPAMFGGKSLMAEIIPGRNASMANGPAREQFLVEFTAAGGLPQVGAMGAQNAAEPLLGHRPVRFDGRSASGLT